MINIEFQIPNGDIVNALGVFRKDNPSVWVGLVHSNSPNILFKLPAKPEQLYFPFYEE